MSKKNFTFPRPLSENVVKYYVFWVATLGSKVPQKFQVYIPANDLYNAILTFFGRNSISVYEAAFYLDKVKILKAQLDTGLNRVNFSVIEIMNRLQIIEHLNTLDCVKLSDSDLDVQFIQRVKASLK